MRGRAAGEGAGRARVQMPTAGMGQRAQMPTAREVRRESEGWPRARSVARVPRVVDDGEQGPPRIRGPPRELLSLTAMGTHGRAKIIRSKGKGHVMETAETLDAKLGRIDRRGYPAYKELRGRYRFEGFALSIDHVQGDPFAAPSQVSVEVPPRVGGWPRELRDTPWRRVALEDFLVRRFGRALARLSFRVGGSGKSGLLATSRPGPEVLPRSACEISGDGTVTLRFEAGFPARGRTVDARALAQMLLDYVPACVDEALVADDASRAAARAATDLADDQHAIREKLDRLGLVAFVADGSVLPRASGVSTRPMDGARAFSSPKSLRVTLDLPHRGRVGGMGIRAGITLIVGGGYHGKSTLLRALQDGVYDHVAGDGRELVITRADAVKLRAEDGRPVRDVDISLFINNLPNGRDTRRFSTEDASGSTSQAASCIEAVEAGCRALLIDEDTSATNFMVRDRVMEAVVAREAEPITPFVERARDLWEQAGVSCVIVAGSSGAFFSIADTVIQMDRYEALDITARAREVCRELGVAPTPRAAGFSLPGETGNDGADRGREPRGLRLQIAGSGGSRVGGRDGGSGNRHGRIGGRRDDRIKVRARGLDEVQVGDGGADIRLIEQLVDPEQAACLARMVRLAAERGLLDGSLDAKGVADATFDLIRREGWNVLAEHGHPSCDLALPRPEELTAVLNRWRAQG